MAAPINRMCPARKCAAIVASDTVELDPIPRAIWVGDISGGTDIKVTLADDTAGVVLSGCVAGTVIPVQPKLVWSTGTDAASLVALYGD